MLIHSWTVTVRKADRQADVASPWLRMQMRDKKPVVRD